MAESRWPEREAIAAWARKNVHLFKEPLSDQVLLQLEPGVTEARIDVQGWLIEARSDVVILKEVLQNLVNAIDDTVGKDWCEDELAAARKILDPKGGG